MIGCATPDCQRAGIRKRDDQWFCMYHPNESAPPIDLISGQLRDPENPTKVKSRVITVPKPKATPAYRAPGRVVVQAGGPCPEKGCVRPARHGGVHSYPKPAKAPRPVREPQSVLTGECPKDGCTRQVRHIGSHNGQPAPAILGGACAVELCSRPGGHSGRHSLPKPERAAKPAKVRRAPTAHTVAAADAARRYQNGERLFDLAADLNIGVKRLRNILNEQGVRIRARGEVIGRRGVEPKPLDTGLIESRYAEGWNYALIAREQQVKGARVADYLREKGLLRPSANARTEFTKDVRVHVDEQLLAKVRDRMLTTGHLYVTHYILDLVRADVAPRAAGRAAGRARNRATAALVELHRAEFDELYADALAQVLEEQAQLVSLAEASGVEVTDDAQVFRLRRGPAGDDQDVTDRAILEPEEPSCRACSTTHDRGHSCPECGTKLGLPVERGTSPKHVKDLAADLLKQRAAEAAAAEADWAWDNAKAVRR